MANKIGIDVQAQIDTEAVSQKINALGQKIAQANKVQYNPVSINTADELAKIVKQFEQLRRVQGDLNKRMKDTQQGGASLLDVDWEKLYPDQHSRARQMRKAFEYAVGGQFSPRPAAPPPPGGQPPPPPAPQRPPPGGTLPGMAVNAAQAGLTAAGPAGRVAADALGTGMSAGFGAGLMGLMGGMLALGVSKIVGGVSEKLDQAQANDVAMDKLKRTLGDVNVSFDALKMVVNTGADKLKITYDEAGRLATQFTKLGNVGSGQAGELGQEMGVGVGLSRAYGLDPSRGVGVMGQMRGVGMTSNLQESRRFALLIGETIGKSKAFAKSEEVMDALAGFATSQTRNNMGRANVAGYAGMYSAMVGSGIPGMDPSGAGSMLGRVNASLSAGGAKGEASQFFTAMVGQRMGLSSLQTQVMREGGMFATNDSMFGQESAYARYMGKAGPKGGATYYANTRSELERQYGGDSEDQKLLRAQAFANHTGLGMNQSMAMLSLKPNQMGGMEKYGNLANLNAAGIGNLSKVLYGSAADRQGVTDSLMRRKDISPDEKEKLRADLGRAGGDENEQRRILATLVATKDQEENDGKVIRDQKAQVDNIATRFADQLIPAVNSMRAGIILIAGKGAMTETQIMKKVAELDSDDRKSTIRGEYASKQQGLNDRASKLQSRLGGLNVDRLRVEHRNDPVKLAEKLKEREAVLAEIAEIDKKRVVLGREENGLLEKENERKKDAIDKIEKARQAADGPAAPEIVGGGDGQRNADDSRRSDAGANMPKGMGALGSDPAFLAKVAANEQEIGAPQGLLRGQMEQESRFHTRAVSPAGAMGLAQVMPKTLRAIEKRVGRKLDPFDADDALLIQKEVMKENHSRFGNWDDATSAYNGGWNKSRWGNPETSNYGPSIKRRMSRYQREGTPLPAGASAPANGAPLYRVTADDITFRVLGADGKPMAPPQTIQTKVRSPYGDLRGVTRNW